MKKCNRAGHPLTPENTRIDRNGTERCKVCERELSARRKYRTKMPAASDRKIVTGPRKSIGDFEHNVGIDVSLCSHVVSPLRRFTAPGVFPAIGHCGACGASVVKDSPDDDWKIPPHRDLPPADFKNPVSISTSDEE